VCADKISACLSTPSDGAASTAICALTSAGGLQVKFRTHTMERRPHSPEQLLVRLAS
jgi:hypothetical protein